MNRPKSLTNAGRGATLSRDPLLKVEKLAAVANIVVETAYERGDNNKQSRVRLSS
jgi:hypothetical protein